MLSITATTEPAEVHGLSLVAVHFNGLLLGASALLLAHFLHRQQRQRQTAQKKYIYIYGFDQAFASLATRIYPSFSDRAHSGAEATSSFARFVLVNSLLGLETLGGALLREASIAPRALSRADRPLRLATTVRVK